MTRDEIAQAMHDTAGSDWGNEAHFQRFAKLLLDTEREACARVIEKYCHDEMTRAEEAKAIRARGET